MPKLKLEWIGAIIFYLITAAFQYGVFSARIAALESNINDIKTDIHEMRSHAWR